MKKILFVAVSLLIMALMIAGCGDSKKAAYPADGDITVIIPKAPGGGTDVSARGLVQMMQKELPGSKFVPVNKPDGGGVTGMVELANAKPDGHTIGMVTVELAMFPHQGKCKNTYKDYASICAPIAAPAALIVPKEAPYNSLDEFVAYAKANPGKVKAATVGKLTGDHIFLMNVEKFTGAQFTQVPYPGGSKAAPALLGGEVDCYFASTSNFLRMQGARGLAIATKDRYELCPDVPTMNELGYKLESAKYRGLATPPNFPAEAQAYLEAALAKVCADPEYQAGVRGAGLLPYYKDGKAFGEIIEQEKEKARKTLKEQGLIQ